MWDVVTCRCFDAVGDPNIYMYMYSFIYMFLIYIKKRRRRKTEVFVYIECYICVSFDRKTHHFSISFKICRALFRGSKRIGRHWNRSWSKSLLLLYISCNVKKIPKNVCVLIDCSNPLFIMLCFGQWPWIIELIKSWFIYIERPVLQSYSNLNYEIFTLIMYSNIFFTYVSKLTVRL